MAVKVVTDSTADLPPGLLEEFDVAVVPLQVIFGREVYREGLEIDHETFYHRLLHGQVFPTTSAPAVGDFLEVYDSLSGAADGILSIHLSARLSATYGAACQAAQIAQERGLNVEVIDSRTGSLAMGFLVLQACRAAARGASLAEVAALVNSLREKVRVYFLLDTLEYLRKGGRIGRASAFLGNLLQVKPILSIRDGEVYPEARVRTRSSALERLYQLSAGASAVKEAAVAYSTDREEGEAFRARLAQLYPHCNIYIARIGPVLGAHVGPGVVGAGFLQGDDGA